MSKKIFYKIFPIGLLIISGLFFANPSLNEVMAQDKPMSTDIVPDTQTDAQKQQAEQISAKLKQGAIDAENKVQSITCPTGSQPYYGGGGGIFFSDPTGNPTGCSVPATSIKRDANGVAQAVCPSGSQAYYSHPSALNTLTLGAAGSGSEFKTCITGAASVTRAGTSTLNIGKVSQDLRPYVVKYELPCDPKIGGGCPSSNTIAGYIARLYQFGLIIVGLFAFAGIIFGGLKYVLSAGSLADQTDAREQITQALLGLVLLLGAYLILYTINPELTQLRNPNAPPVNLSELEPEGDTAVGRQVSGDGTGSDDALCLIAVDTGISFGINANITPGRGEVGSAISDAIGNAFSKKEVAGCIKCKANASKDSSGACSCDANYSKSGNECVNESACNSKTGFIWRDGTCVEDKSLGF